MKRKLFFLQLIIIGMITVRGFAQSWSHVGPLSNNLTSGVFETGRADCIALDNGFDGITNQTIYAGSISGSLWVSTNLASSWSPVSIPDAVTFHGISALTSTPSGYMLVSTVSRGAVPDQNGNIYQFYPLTNTWISTGFAGTVGPGSTYVNHIRVCPSNASIILAATSGGIYRSADGGMTWNQVLTGIYENVDFIPATWITGGFQVYASGDNSIVFSTDMGLTYTSKASVTAVLSPPYYVDLGTTFNSASPNTRYIYFDALDASSAQHHLVRLSLDMNTPGLETVSDFGTVYEAAPSSDRMWVAASDQVVYLGNGGIIKYNALTSSFYTVSSGFADSPTTGVAYNNPVHSDSHDGLMFPGLNQIYFVCDGGFFINNYVPGANQVFTNNWSRANNNLNISQIWGLSCAEEDPDEYITGEQDTKAFLTSSATNTFLAQGNEPSQVLIDHFNKNNYIQSYDRTTDTYGTYDGNTLFNNYVESWTGSGSMCNATANTFFGAPGFGTNDLFQDPNRPDKIYMGTALGGVTEFCTTTRQFVLKKGFLPSWDVQYINGMAFSRANKNKVYTTLSSRYAPSIGDLKPPQVFAFTGPDFDNSWLGFNDGPGSWTDITPNFSLSPFTSPLSASQAAQMQFVGVAASDWNPDRIWLALQNVPGNPSLKVIKRESGVWTDCSSGIPASEFPISLIYEQGTNDQLYLGTNVNIYVWNPGTAAWTPYSGTLPNIGMNQLRINYTENTLRVGTYGQGMWKSPLNCPALPSITLNGTTINTDQFYEAQNFIQISNTTIANGSVKARAGEYIDMLPDFLVTANNTTDYFAFIHGCNTGGTSYFRETKPVEFQEIKKAMKAQFSLNAFPNPTSGIITVQCPETTEGDSPRLEIYDLRGGLVYSRTVSGITEINVDLNDQPKGIYILKYISIQGVKTLKLIRD